jgi:hypothetical protein
VGVDCKLLDQACFFPQNISNLNCSNIKVQLGDFIDRLGPAAVLLVYRCWSVIVGLSVLIAVAFFSVLLSGKGE